MAKIQICSMVRTAEVSRGSAKGRKLRKAFQRLLFWEGFPGDSVIKESTCNAGEPGSIPGLGRAPGEGNGNPLQYSCLGNPMKAVVHGVT